MWKTRTSHAGGLGTLAVCAAGICGCYLYFGVLQERLFTGETRMGATFTLVTACLTNAFVAILWHAAVEAFGLKSATKNGPHESQQARLHHRQLILTSFCYVTAMVCSNEAIQYVSYPVAVLAKSCKLIPTMILGQIVEGRRYSNEEWMAAVLISFGIVAFHFSRMFESLSFVASDKDVNAKDTFWSNSQFGMALLLFSLLMDGLLSSTQNLLKRRSNGFRPPTAVETMLYVNLYALVFVIPLSIAQGQWEAGLLTLSDSARRGHHVVFWNLLMINLVVGVGQIFIFLTIQLYSSMIVTTITTTRKFLTILLSVWTFGHRFTILQWAAIVLVFAGLYLVILVQRKEYLRKMKLA
jgi:solute carrier family 35 (UDP-galactose transporter), member B1